MKNLRLWLFSAIVFALTAPIASAQLRNVGQVVEVLDGKTVVVAVPTGRVKVELQAIDVPEAGQPLHAAMTDHVRTLLLGKAVELQTNGFTHEKLTGKLVLNGVDVSQQLLRNGAAWHLQIEKSGQNQAEFAAYAESETLARLEKRGVWSVAGLEPAWVFREKKQAAAAQPVSKAAPVSEYKPVAKRKGYWADDNPKIKNVSGVSHGFNAATQTGFLGMALFQVTDDKEAPRGQSTYVDITYYYTETAKGRTGYFQVTVYSVAERWRFLKNNALVIESDGKKHVVGKPKRETESTAEQMSEKLTYRVDMATIEKIAYGGEVFVKVGDYTMTPRPMVQMLLYKLINAAK